MVEVALSSILIRIMSHLKIYSKSLSHYQQDKIPLIVY